MNPTELIGLLMATARAMKSRFAQLTAVALALSLAGCASPDPQPFQRYAAAVKEAGDGVDHVLAQDIGWSRELYINGVLAGSVRLRDTALLDETAPFTVSFPSRGKTSDEPTFYRLQEARATLTGLNDATEKYLNVLTVLSGKDVVDPKAFETLAVDSDASLNSMASRLDAQVPGSAIHIFSVGGAEIARLVVEKKREAALERILIESQPCIDDYCKKCGSLLVILDQSLASDYTVKSSALEERYHEISNGKPTRDPAARAVVEELLQLNSDYIGLVDSLKSARKVYEAMPRGHLELLKSVKRQPAAFEAINDINAAGKRLETIYNGPQPAGK
jgi:hypothetical protein